MFLFFKNLKTNFDGERYLSVTLFRSYWFMFHAKISRLEVLDGTAAL